MTGRAVLVGLALLAALLTFLVFAGSSEGRCGLKCLNRQVNALRLQYLPLRMQRLEERIDAQSAYVSWLEARDAKLEAEVSGLLSFQHCTAEVPLSRYGEPTGPSGYVFRLEGKEGPAFLPTTALDLTYPNDPVGAWALVNACNQEGITPRSALVHQALGPKAHFYEATTQHPRLRLRRGR